MFALSAPTQLKDMVYYGLTFSSNLVILEPLYVKRVRTIDELTYRASLYGGGYQQWIR